MIQNVLLRLDRVSGIAPPPFENPNPKMAFWVLEISIPRKSKNPFNIIQKKISEVSTLIPAHCLRTLHIEHSYADSVFRIPESLISVLAECGCSLEILNTPE
jgi:hypothetical protein